MSEIDFFEGVCASGVLFLARRIEHIDFHYGYLIPFENIDEIQWLLRWLLRRCVLWGKVCSSFKFQLAAYLL